MESDSQGTVFSLFFPASEERPAVLEDSLSMVDLRGRGERILVVDDEETQRDITRKMLQLFGYSVHTVASGEEAIAWLRSRSVDLILLDMIMDPGINGCETYAEIIKIHPDQKAIIASGFSRSEEVKKAQAMGAGQLLCKPYTLLELGLVVNQALHGA
ncbi:response regulator [Desulfolithobacter dissulfuricans]|uniref:response regulator n=1 Tax=Desulfolithobacter dissulfuricans TaxID=2795293 RepID=UPI002278B336|nr:response regulator [Desulfolithobacter dissulfuricans]